MKRVFAFLLFLMVPFAPVCGQGLHGKVLLLREFSWFGPDSLQTFLALNYHGQVDSESSLPMDLSQFDAILMEVHSPVFYSSDTLSVKDQLGIIDYIKSGGRLYAEGDGFLKNDFFPKDTISDPGDTLWHFLGLANERYDGFVDSYDTIIGVDSEFTRGFLIPQAFGEAFELSTYYPGGSIKPVLLGPESPGGYLLDILAWVPADRSLIAVMHHPIVANYYYAFLTRVLCDYFGLCTDAVEEQKPTPSTYLRIVSDGNQTWLDVEGRETGELDIENALGIRVFRCTTARGGGRIQVPNTLPSGFYFARLQMNGASEMWPFAFVQE